MKLADGVIKIGDKSVAYLEHELRNCTLIPDIEQVRSLEWNEILTLKEELDKKSKHLDFMRKRYATMLITDLSLRDDALLT